MDEIVVSSSPFMHSKNDVNRLFLYIILALLFPAIYGVMLYGFGALSMVFISIASCLLFEILFNYFDKRKIFLKDLSCFVTGFILALTLPYGTPNLVIVFAAFFSIVVVKLAFGGLGRNIFNPALVGRCVAGLMIPNITAELYKITIAGDEYVSILVGGTNTLSNLISGQAVGGIGTTCILMFLIIYIFMANLGIINIKIPIISIISYFAVGVLFNDIETTAINMCSGSFIFITVFMMTEPNTSPNSLFGELVYSFMFGALSAICWNYGYFGENCIFVVALAVNLFVPFMDRFLVLKPATVGGYRYAHKK
ncbi:MAG: RnfABCDGE type electron transport complex subunit D [Clostridia bacterium]|nr:RnfABCDGE type electron transport complex subunit D [Clostridia bacterium]